MLPAKYRLPLRRTLPFYLFSKKAHTPEFSFYWEKTSEPFPARVAIVVPKKVARTAVLRNRTKRVLGSALLPTLPDLPQGLQCVILVRSIRVAENPVAVVQRIADLLR